MAPVFSSVHNPTWASFVHNCIVTSIFIASIVAILSTAAPGEISVSDLNLFSGKIISPLMKGAVGQASSHLPGFLLLELAPCLKPVAGCHRASPSTTLDKSQYFINNDHNSNNRNCQEHAQIFYCKLIPRGKSSSPLGAFCRITSVQRLSRLYLLAASACSRSAIRSAASSSPKDSRTRSSGAPALALCSGDSCEWVVLAG